MIREKVDFSEVDNNISQSLEALKKADFDNLTNKEKMDLLKKVEEVEILAKQVKNKFKD